MEKEEIYCSKCGKAYPGKEKKCPECGEPNHYLSGKKAKSLLKWFGFGLLAGCILATLLMSLLNYSLLSKIYAEFDTVESYSGSSEEENESSSEVVLSDYTFYDEYLLTSTDLPDDEDYFIYFHSDYCSYCVAYGNSYILTYYNIPESGDSDAYIFDSHPVYFAESGTEVGDAIAEQFGVESTPGIIRITNGQLVRKGEGYDEIYDLIGEVVNSYYE